MFCVLLSCMLMLNVPFTSSAKEENTSKDYYSTFVEAYEVNRDLILEGDMTDFVISIFDQGIKSSTTVEEVAIEMGTSSSFKDGYYNFIEDNTITYDPLCDGARFKLHLKDLYYFGNGHRLSASYVIRTENGIYRNFFSFYVIETMHPRRQKENNNIAIPCEMETNYNDESLQNDSLKANACDSWVLETQRWLNQRYTGKYGYTPIAENGIPGTIVSESLVTALQIELGISEPTGYFGGQTAAQFTRQVSSLSNGCVDRDKPFVRILQYALFCKGYNPSAVTGTFGERTSAAVLKLKHNAGLTDTSDSSVNAMWMKAILTSDAYVCVNNGDRKIRQIQQQLNRNYFNYCGIMPCDGHYSRDTNEALIYALQAEEGLDVYTANGYFGPTTKLLCPNLPNDSRYSATSLKAFTKILQYSLYCNKVDGYKNIQFSGEYDNTTRNAVANFQRFACLDNRSGNADVSTIMSLLISKGDPERSAKGCDCATQLNHSKAKALYDSGYRYVGRYLTGTVGDNFVPKNLTINEIHQISDVGLRIFPIYQDGGASKAYFNKEQGIKDANIAIKTAAQEIFIPKDSIIYFAVDCDLMDCEVTTNVIPYFEGVNEAMQNNNYGDYRIGVYGARNICSRVSDKGLACSSFVSDMSTGFSGNFGYPLPSNWAFDQFDEYDFSKNGEKFGIDKDAVSGRDEGFCVTGGNFRYTSYNRAAVREYIDKWWSGEHGHGRNPEFYDYSQNCANFASQCLLAGGLPMNALWYSTKTPKLTSDEDELSCRADWGTGMWQNYAYDWNISLPWRRAEVQYAFFSNKDNYYINGDVLVINSVDEIAPTIQNAKNSGNPIQVGDLMYFVDNGVPHHATVISEMTNDMIKYAANTDSRHTRELGISLGNESVYIIRIRDK